MTSGQSAMRPEGRREWAAGRLAEFFDGLEASLKDFQRDYCFPAFRLPWRARLIPLQLQVKEVVPEDDLVRIWRNALTQSGLSVEEGCLGFRTYELKGGGIRYRVAAVFVTPAGGAGQIGSVHLACAAKVLRDFPQGDRLTLGVLSTGLDKRNYLPVEIDVLPMN